MSNTPRTDAVARLMATLQPGEWADHAIDLGRNLERELAVANKRIAELDNALVAAIAAHVVDSKRLVECKRVVAELEALLPESLEAIEENHTDHCPAWCGYRELRVKLRAAIDAARKASE